jgi:hypothetical protein
VLDILIPMHVHALQSSGYSTLQSVFGRLGSISGAASSMFYFSIERPGFGALGFWVSIDPSIIVSLGPRLFSADLRFGETRFYAIYGLSVLSQALFEPHERVCPYDLLSTRSFGGLRIWVKGIVD